MLRVAFIAAFMASMMALPPGASGRDIVFNEVMSSNRITISDEDGDYNDWIELFNVGDSSVTLTGWGLTDDPSQLLFWTFPPITIDPGHHRLLFASDKDRALVARYDETVIRKGDVWRWHSGVTPPPENWRRPDFNDAGWRGGPSGFGYGDGDDETNVPQALSLFLRKTFTVFNPGDVVYAMLHMDYDDGFVAYINNVEVARANIGVPGVPPAYSDSAQGDREARMYRGLPPELFIIRAPQATLRPGANLLAIQVHNSTSVSSDMSAIPFLTLGLRSAPDTVRGMAEEIKEALPPLHTNFKIASEGESLILTRADGTRADSLYTGALPEDVSLGRSPDGADEWLLFDQPTPGLRNGREGLRLPTAVPIPSRNAGLYFPPLSLTFEHADPLAVVYYTLDGSPPDANSPVFRTPISIDTTTVVRAIAYSPSGPPSDIVTNTYIMGYLPSLAVFSLSTDPFNLWDPDSGIYVLGRNYDPEPPHRGANFWQDWERPVHVEFFEPDGFKAFGMGAGVKVHGGWTRYFPQKSLDIYLRREYGENRVNHQLFPDLPFDSFKNFTLRNSGSDWDHTMFRDALMTSLIKDENVDIQGYRPVVVFLNGAYWGMYNLREKLNEHYAANHYGIDPDSVDRMEVWGGVTQGSGETYFGMLSYMENNVLTDSAKFAWVAQRMDIDNFLTYNAANIYCDNTDWPGNNNKFWRPHYAWGKWRWFTFDLDFGFGLHDENAWNHNALADATAPDGTGWPNPPIATFVLRKCLENQEFKWAFINRFAELMNGPYKPSNVARRIDEIKSVILPEIPRHLARWERTVPGWESKVAELQPFADRRPDAMRRHISEFFGLAGTVNLTFDVSPPGSGELRINRRLIAPPHSGVWFRGVPLDLFAAPEPGYRFSRWETGSREQSRRWSPGTDFRMVAYFEPFETAASLIVVNEISPLDSGAMNAGDWIEFVVFTDNHDLTGWTLKDDNDNHSFRFPDGFSVQAGEYFVVAADTERFNLRFPGSVRVAGQMDFGLRASGDMVRLFSASGKLVDSVAYTNLPPWPELSVTADGIPVTLELGDPGRPNEDARYWRASPRLGGSPGRTNIYLPPTPFELLFPLEGDTVEDFQPLLIWSSSLSRAGSQRVSYQLEWAANPEFDPSLRVIVSDTAFYLTTMPPVLNSADGAGTDELDPETRFWWRVTARDDGGLTTAGIPLGGRSFVTGKLPDPPPVPDLYAVAPPYPNPANSSFTVAFELPDPAELTFTLYDIRGRMKWSLTEKKPAGFHRMDFGAENGVRELPSGLYFLQVAGESEIKVFKIALLR